MKNTYIPQRGDFFSCNDQEYFCIDSNPISGVVNPVKECYYINNFKWSIANPVFIRKASENELKHYFDA